MGYLIEKYTEKYFLREGESGQILHYGVEGVESFRQGSLREHDKEILEHVNFDGARVLEFGFGRGETIKYAWERKAASYIGVDFSEAACRIAGEFLERYGIKGPKIYQSDALEFVRTYASTQVENASGQLDVVMMLDFVEHVPRTELVEILTLLRPCLSASAVLVVNTPDFFVDNDVVKEGLNELGRDSSDLVAETQGMHCNRYTLDSLRCFFAELGYLAVSRGHYFVLATAPQNVSQGAMSYRLLWNKARERGCRLLGEWPREIFEVPYAVAEIPELKTFDQGNLAGISLYITKSYEEYYRNGNYDDFLSEYLTRFDLSGQTVFDIGAFVGANTLQFSGLVGEGGLVCSFEPNPFNRDRLRLNLSENSVLDERVRVFPFAVSDQEGQVNFRLHRNVDAGISSASYIEGAHTTLTDLELSNLGFADVSVDVCTIDDFVERTGFSPKCMKLDIEGAEHLALFGAAKTLATHRPILLIELHSTFCAATVINTLAKLGYTSEVLFVEPDGRCFIGANSEGTVGTKTEPAVLQLQLETLRSEMAIVRRNEADAVRLNVSMQETVTLKAELANASDRMKELENLHLELQRDFNDQQIILASVRANLMRYQLFPVIRLARKIKRIFSRNK